MGRSTRMILMALAIFFGLAGRAAATTYYVAANGSDSNNGTSESSPWQHAPGMPNCTANCAAKTPQPGDSFIFRGGDAWHRSANTNDSSDVAMGGQWTWTWSGSGLGTTCDYPSATTTCIYLGVDTITPWYNSAVCGSSFCRPQLELDNPIWAKSTHQDSVHGPGFVTACSYDDYNVRGLNAMAAKGIILDNWNVWGKCWTQIPNGGGNELSVSGSADSYNAVVDAYIHGWTETYNPQPNGSAPFDQAAMVSYVSSPTPTHNTIAHDVFDGSDSCPKALGNTMSNCTGGPVSYGDCFNFFDNVVRYVANGCNPQYNAVSVHDNLFDEMWESYDPADHGGIMEAANPPNDAVASNQYWYNNTVRNSGMGITWEISTLGGYSAYIFNNIFYGLGNGGNCLIIDGTQTPSPNVYITNNTFDRIATVDGTACTIRFQANPSPDFNGYVTLQNNDLIGGFSSPLNSSSNLFNVCSGCSATITDAGNEVFQSEAAANAEGYTPSDNYEPPSSGCTSSANCATYEAGSDLAVDCAIDGTALCSGSTGGAVDAPGTGALPVLDILLPTLRAVSWDAGAYQYSGNTAGGPIAPTGLIATVQ